MIAPNIFDGNEGVPRGLLIVTKNVFSVLYFFVVSNILKITHASANKILAEAKLSEKKSTQVAYVVNKLSEEHSNAIKKLFVAMIIYGLFCIPHLWGYAYVPYTFLQTIASGKNHIVYWYIAAGKADSIENKNKDTTDRNTDSNDPQSVTGGNNPRVMAVSVRNLTSPQSREESSVHPENVAPNESTI